MKTKKLWASIVLLSILFLAVFPFAIPTSAESLYIKKIVSVVYDDSGSMEGDKAAYANYAVQSFCGMLNSNDKLYIQYMSEAMGGDEGKEYSLETKNFKETLETIRNHKQNPAGTPFEAVEMAYNRLSSVKDLNPNTQYWLVIITDGEFDKKTSDEVQRTIDSYADTTMPNGSHPQITYLAIGDDVFSITENKQKGIFSFSAADAEEITQAMSALADRISGRTRLEQGTVKQINDTTIEVSSAIPLLNIVTFAQKTNAKVIGASHNDGTPLPISRSATIDYDNGLNFPNLLGSTALIGDSQKIIEAGTYNIVFDRKVSLNNIVVLYEPALETRVTITLNGKELADPSELKTNSAKGDEISVSFDVYEMGKDKKIDLSLLPSNTQYGITVLEGGNTTSSTSGMSLSSYILKNVGTQIRAFVKIEGFNPIETVVNFTPQEYIQRIVYTMDAKQESNAFLLTDETISSNHDFHVYFTVYADGVAMTDPDEVKLLKPTVQLSPRGNDGTLEVMNDGRICFTPDKLGDKPENADALDVTVSCTISDGTKAESTYSVSLVKYQVVPLAVSEMAKKTELFQNKKGVSFIILKNGEQLKKSEIGSGIAVSLDEHHKNPSYDFRTTIADDGTITVTPFRTDEYVAKNKNLLMYWWEYSKYDNKDFDISLAFANQQASNTLKVGQDWKVFWLEVFLPAFIEALILAFIIYWILAIIFKPRFDSKCYFYYGDIRVSEYFGKDRIDLTIKSLSRVQASQYNRFSNIWKPYFHGQVISLFGNSDIRIRAEKYGMIIIYFGEYVYKLGKLPQGYSDNKGRSRVFDTSLDYLVDHGNVFYKRALVYSSSPMTVDEYTDGTNAYVLLTDEFNKHPKEGSIFFIYQSDD